MTKSTIYTLDAGNSSEKLVQWMSGAPVSFVSIAHPSKLDTIVFSTVKHRPLLPEVNTILEIKQIGLDFFGTMPTNYGKTAGIDRLLFAYDVYNDLIKDNISKVLLVDVGTFCTIDIVTTNGFQGGTIVPGLQLLNRCFDHGKLLEQPTALPTSSLSYPFKSTDETLRSSSTHLLVSNISHVFRLENPQKVIITGGDALHIIPHLNELQIPLEHEPFAGHKGLYRYYKEEFGQQARDMK